MSLTIWAAMCQPRLVKLNKVVKKLIHDTTYLLTLWRKLKSLRFASKEAIVVTGWIIVNQGLLSLINLGSDFDCFSECHSLFFLPVLATDAKPFASLNSLILSMSKILLNPVKTLLPPSMESLIPQHHPPSHLINSVICSGMIIVVSNSKFTALLNNLFNVLFNSYSTTCSPLCSTCLTYLPLMTSSSPLPSS